MNDPTMSDWKKQVAIHAKSDLEYVAGLRAHLNNGEGCSGRNVSDLMSIVEWNATHLLDALSYIDDDPDDTSIPSPTEAAIAEWQDLNGLSADERPEGPTTLTEDGVSEN